MIKMIVRSFENKDEILEMEVEKYQDCGNRYELEFKDGWGSIPKERVVRIEEVKENKGIDFKVGDGGTISYYSDKVAVTVIEIGKNYVKVQEDESIRLDNNGMSDSQVYEYKRDVNGRVYEFKKTRKGLYTDNGRSKDYGCRLHIGFRRTYYDYSF